MVSEIIAMISAIILFLNESWAIALYILKVIDLNGISCAVDKLIQSSGHILSELCHCCNYVAFIYKII